MIQSAWRVRAISRYRQLRESEGLTQAKLAEVVGVTQGSIAHWFNGRRSPETLDQYERLAKGLKMHPAELLYGINPDLSCAFDKLPPPKQQTFAQAIRTLINTE